MRRTLAFALLLALAAPARAAEIDSVTPRSEDLRDARSHLEGWLNQRLRRGVERANAKGKGCDEAELYRQLKRAIKRPFIGHSIAEELNADGHLDSARVRFRDSIYRDLGLLEALSVHVKDLSSVIRLGGHLVGVDKFGHFLVQGWKYFEVAYLDGRGVAEAIDWGEGTERTYFGLYTTGVYSYADLAVNFEGMRFWRRVLGQGRDPLLRGYFASRPYVGCRKGLFRRQPRWRLQRDVELDDYLSGAWDEAVNCPAFRNGEIAERIAQRVAEREAADARSYACPIAPAACARAQERYGSFAGRLLHPRCLAAPPPPRPWWRFW